MGFIVPAVGTKCRNWRPFPNSHNVPSSTSSDTVMYHDPQYNTPPDPLRPDKASEVGPERPQSCSIGEVLAYGHHNSQTSCIPLTTQVLHEHNIQQTNLNQRFSDESANEQYHNSDPDIGNGSQVLITASSVQTQGAPTVEEMIITQRSIYNNADRRRDHDNHHKATASHPPPEWDSEQSTHRHLSDEHVSSMARYNDLYTLEHLHNATDYTSWPNDTDDEPIAWGNDFAGIGQQFEDFNYQRYANVDDFVVE